MNETLPGTVGDEEAEVLREAARLLGRLAAQLPECSRWTDVMMGVAEGFDAGAHLSQMGQRHAA